MQNNKKSNPSMQNKRDFFGNIKRISKQENPTLSGHATNKTGVSENRFIFVALTLRAK